MDIQQSLADTIKYYSAPQAVVLTMEDCKWCDMVKELLTSKGYHITELNIMSSDTLQKFMSERQLMTVPQVFINNELIGGYQATNQYFIERLNNE